MGRGETRRISSALAPPMSLDARPDRNADAGDGMPSPRLHSRLLAI